MAEVNVIPKNVCSVRKHGEDIRVDILADNINLRIVIEHGRVDVIKTAVDGRFSNAKEYIINRGEIKPEW